ncbi:MAG TPA: SusC/RagA family TonB-linked outer membrane protein [Puia sp.]|nr:SusC/RagA family TonB-linked outer membrane protein [Puia sp.]
MPVYCQSSTGITLSEKDAPLEKILIAIRKQGGYTYFGDAAWTQLAKNVTIYVKNAGIREVLDICFKDQPLRYALVGTSISIQVIPSTAPIVRGRLINEKKEPIAGATITVKGNKSAITTSNDNGEFAIRAAQEDSSLVITSIGYITREQSFIGAKDLVITLKDRISELVDVSVVANNGYQEIPKDRATGSFTQVSNALINRRVSPNILDRLDGVTSSLLFNKNVVSGTNESAIVIRGRSTISGNPDPLVIIDNFPYSGDINNLNPDDVESITILKDAAAASIWGAFSGNGVIVITTKKGKYNQAPKWSFTTSTTLGKKPDLYYLPILSSPDYIDVEEYLFNHSYYSGANDDPQHGVVSPVVEILLNKQLSPAEAQAQINVLRGQDTRQDLGHYFYRTSQNHQYALNLDGGGSRNHYYFSAGYDKNLANLVRNGYSRVTLNANNTYNLLPEKLELSTGLSFTSSTTQNNNNSAIIVTYPYLKLADAQGNALSVPHLLRQSYVDTAGGGRLLDWNYRPLDELRNADNVTKLTDYRINLGIRYVILKGLEANAHYQYGHGSTDLENFQSQQTYYTRNLINEYTQVDSAGVLTRPIPLGGILDKTLTGYDANNIRLQLNYDRLLGKDQLHDFNAIAGAELRDVEQQISSSRQYGYDPIRRNGLPVDYSTSFPLYSSPGSLAKIPYSEFNHNSATSDRYLSYYINASYIYRQRYVLSASARRDESNLFGVNANQRGVPLWSAGAAWEVSKEDFYRLDWLPILKLRVTYGYNGNVDRSVSAYTTALINTGFNSYGATTATVNNPPNPSLRWERINIFNVGVDFGSKGGRVEGTLEYYIKTGKDLIGQSPLDPTTGNVFFTGNTANMRTRGADITVRAKNSIGPIQWNTVFLFSYARDKVTSYGQKLGAVLNYFNMSAINPIVGRPLYSVYALKWMGLDPQNGNPQGALAGHATEDYNSVFYSSDLSNLLYKGPANPPVFGSLRNSFGWKQWQLSFNIVYKFGYYFRRSSINYYDLFGGVSKGHPDYERRWQGPGDEKSTYVPSMIFPADPLRDNFYGYSEPLIEKGDHIRLQDIQFSYDLSKKSIPKWPVQSIRLYVYANNIGILWKANHQGIDPDYVTSIPNPRTLAMGVKLNF